VIEAADNVKITALADVFEDRLQYLRDRLKEQTGQEVADENCFIGFDSYKQLLDTDVDYVIFTAPPAFRPTHFKYAVEKGKHCFLEKPIAIDPKGYRTIMAAAKQAAARNLVVVCGTQRHHERPYVEAFEKISQGLIGEITGGNVYWNQSMLWYRNREKGWSDMEWMIRDWVNWTWLSGDHICEQHVHNIDVFLWMSGYKVKSASAFGSRHGRITGDQYDNFSTDYVCENGVHFQSMCRQINGCTNSIGEEIFGTKGSWNSFTHEIKDLDGNVIWKYDAEAQEQIYKLHDPYTLEHVDGINHIRRGEGHDEATGCAMSCLAGIMGREAAYTGKTITWDEMSQSEQNLLPENPQMGPMDMAKYKVPVPGEAQQ
jgi:predicted dehydrogenase